MEDFFFDFRQSRRLVREPLARVAGLFLLVTLFPAVSLAAILSGTAASSLDLLDYANHQNIRVPFTSPLEVTPVILSASPDLISVHPTPTGFSAGTRTHQVPLSNWLHATIFGGYESTFETINSRPACAFMNSSGVGFAYPTGANLNSEWNIVAVDRDFDITQQLYGGFNLTLFTASSRPVIFYPKPGDSTIWMAFASDSNGETWHAQSTGLPGGENFSVLSAGEINSRPAIAYADQTGRVVFATPAQDDWKGLWRATLVVDSKAYLAGSKSLGELNGRPALVYSELAAPGLRFAIAADAQGNGPWQTTIIDTNGGFGASLRVLNGKPLVAYSQAFRQPVNGGFSEHLRIRVARAENNLSAWTAETVGDGDGQTRIAQIGSRTVLSSYGVNRGFGAAGAFVAADATFRTWLPLPDNTGVSVPLDSIDARAKQQTWLEWDGKPVLHIGGQNAENGIYVLPQLSWRAEKGPVLAASPGAKRFVDAPGSPYKLGTEANWVGRDIHFSVADLTGDGKLDLAVADYNGRSARLFRGDGQGRLQEVWSQTLPFDPQMIAPANLNSDTNLDLIVWGSGAFFTDPAALTLVATSNSFTVGKQFVRPIADPSKDPYSSADLAFAADLNRDGLLDYLVQWGFDAREYTIFLGTSSGEYSPSASSPYKLPNGGRSAMASDLNRDGVPDLIFSNQPGIGLLLSDRSDAFFHFEQIDLHGDLMATGDLDGDGDIDIAVSSYVGQQNGVRILINRDGARLDLGPFLPSGREFPPMLLAIADADGDGLADIIAPQIGGGIVILQNEGNLNFSTMRGSPFPSGSYPGALAVADLNSDSLPDLIIANNAGREIRILLGVGSKTPLTLDCVGVPGHAYAVERTGSLSDPAWEPITSVVAGPDGRFRYIDQSSTTNAFYRAVGP